MSRSIRNLPINRVEGDLDVSVDLEDNRVIKARISGTMFRGFEKMMKGRGLLDGLVITPRICGICSTSHLYAAALALDDLQHAQVPDNAIRMRNLTHIVEHLQSDLRHLILMFAVDFAHPSYAGRNFFAEAQRRYTPLQGTSAISTIKATRGILEIIAIIGGQWPHSSFMVPGGIVSTPSGADLRKCHQIMQQFKHWFEREIIGGPLVEWQKVTSCQDLEAWCQDPSHRHADLTHLIQIGQELKLDQGRSDHGLICGGGLPLPKAETETDRSHFYPAGHLKAGKLSSFKVSHISEQLSSSFYHQSQYAPSSVFHAETVPVADKENAYSWVKAPRYTGQPVETSPLADLLCNKHPLLSDWVATKGISPLARELARLLRPAELIPTALRWIKETDQLQSYYQEPKPLDSGRGLGIVQASRGMLGHWLKAREGEIQNYQMITPTSWNASPKDDRGLSGPMEQALMGIEIENPDNPLELGHILRSFDPCLVCAVHSLHRGQKISFRLGALP